MNGLARTVAIVQARMGSTRLPGKVLIDLDGRPMLWHVVSRLRRASRIDAVGVATSASPADDPIAAFCRDIDVPCVRGSEQDVLDRYRKAARELDAATVVRITADCPLLDPAVVDRVVEAFAGGGHDYACNVLRPTYPDGLDVEVFSREALERAWGEASGVAEREHVTIYLRTSGRFRVAPNVECQPDLSGRNLRWTVDSPADLAFVRAVYAALGTDGAPFGLPEVLRLLEEHPEMSEINGAAVRNEGYYLSLTAEPPVPTRARSLARSAALLAEAESLIPGASQTFSKAPSQYVQGVAPTFLARGQGSHVWDVDGNEYLDYPMGLAPVVLGHNDPDVTTAVVRQMQDGTAYSLPHPLEVEVAALLREVVPCAEMARFGKNGSDVTAGAVRLARAVTGRDVIICCGYHGWQDWYIGTTTRNKGVPKAVQELARTFTYNDAESLARVLDEFRGRVAGVVMEPVGVAEPKPGFLERVRELTRTHGVLLIYDEIVTGFRWALGGAQEYFGVAPDLACFGKAMANGFPISALVGPRDLMAVCDEIFFSFTLGGETVGLAAAKATIGKLRREPVIPHLWAQGQRLKDGYNSLARHYGVERYTRCIGYAPRTVITFHDQDGSESLLFKSYIQQECLKRGILFSGGQNLSYSHTDADVERTLRVYRTVLELFREALAAGDVAARLEGPPVQPVFRRA